MKALAILFVLATCIHSEVIAMDEMTNIRIKDRVEVAPGVNGLQKAILTHPSGSRAELQFYGAHVTSWKNAAGEELFFWSEKSFMEYGKPMRGGIPVCWPQFGTRGNMMLHGFARINGWKPVSSGVTPEGETQVTLRLTENDETLKIWPYPFQLEYTVTLGDSLTASIKAVNTGTEAFRFTTGLHTYFSIGDINRTSVSGLQGTDIVEYPSMKLGQKETRDKITFNGFTNLVYNNVPEVITINDDANNRKFFIRKSGFPDAILWNAWKGTEELTDTAYLGFLCMESIVFVDPINLNPGESWSASAKYTVQ